jgi:tetratricopeptide (TPR) repeat protein
MSEKEEKPGLRYRDNKKSPPLHLRIAEKEINEKNFTKAIDILESIVNNDPRNAAPYFLLGKAHAGDGNFRIALQNFRKGSDLIGSEKTYQFYLREVETMKRKFEDNITRVKTFSNDFSALLKSIPASEKRTALTEPDIDENLISETLAKIYLNQGETTEAIRVYEKLIRKFPVKKLYFEAKISEIRSGTE